MEDISVAYMRCSITGDTLSRHDILPVNNGTIYSTNITKTISHDYV